MKKYDRLMSYPLLSRQGFRRLIMDKMQAIYKGFHMQMLTVDGDATEFYKEMRFSHAVQTEPMWIYSGGDH